MMTETVTAYKCPMCDGSGRVYRSSWRVEVTEDDIAAGVPEDVDRCPIALAANRALGVDSAQSVYGRLIGSTFNFLLPSKAQTFQRAFDRGKPVKPIAFDVSR